MDFLSVFGIPPSPVAWVALATVLGLLVGSFLNVVIHRLPLIMEREWRSQCAELHGDPVPEQPPLTLSRPASRCPSCGAAIRPWHNIPLISWMLLGGKCAACAAPISLRYPLVELLSATLTGLAAWHFGFTAMAAGAIVFTWALIALAGIDLDTQLLPDSITLPLLWLGLALALFPVFVDLPAAVIGAMAGYLSLWSVYWLFKLLTGKEGMGYGDFKLLAALGAWMGWQVLPLIILLSSLVGAVVGIALILGAGRGRSVPIPFGPYLAAAGLIALYAGKPLTHQYLALVS